MLIDFNDLCFSVFHHNESSASDSDDESDETRRMIKIKAAHSHKGPYDFDLLVPVQEVPSAHNVSAHFRLALAK